ncbi:hypothetical protein N7478_004502 [Penicillium angulare]|uniref:uncharacterized protein n=1 Tax=Penicillium angulare TaxID=116970 RepID=UPI00253F7798|nr:uncharacterized protein N7478_004502 [Penicillium angulare]KAJ5279130.1 hypothetical protein N7478_004502 [Penicillium angulare]
MAGGKTTPKAKRASKASPKSKLSTGLKNVYTGNADAKLILLYMCCKNKEGPIDFKAVGQAYGISPTAAQYRFYRLRDFMEKQELPDKQKAPTGNDDDSVEIEDHEEQAEDKETKQDLDMKQEEDFETLFEG